MTRWLVTFDDAVHDAESPAEAVNIAAEQDSVPVGAVVFVIDLDAIEGTDRCHLMTFGGYPVDPEERKAELERRRRA